LQFLPPFPLVIRSPSGDIHITPSKSKGLTMKLFRCSRRPAPRFRPGTIPPRLEVLEDRTVLTGLGYAEPDYLVYAPPHGSKPLATPTPTGYTPRQILHAYAFDQIALPGGARADGTGTTIAIVDAYDDPNIANDLHRFDLQFQLPDPTFIKINQNGGTVFPPTDPTGGWEGEIALDVEWSHAIAPAAKIMLVEADDNSYTNLLAGVTYAAGQPGVVALSMSWGGPEFDVESSLDGAFVTPTGHPGVTFVAATGDTGAPPEYPTTSPNVLAVGGTTLNLDNQGKSLSESAWSGSTGGISAFEPQPTYQAGAITQSFRTNPDVAYNSDPSTGFPVYDSYNNGTSTPWWQLGGTSDAAPQWAALIALADQGRLLAGESTLDGPSQTLPMLYGLSEGDFQDITAGSSYGTPIYSAGPGYDLATGRGTPVANKIVADLIGVPITVQSTTTVTSSANPQMAGQPVSWTATVAPASGAVNYVNFETGDFSQAASHAGGAIVSNPALGGTYSLQLQRSGSVGYYEIRQSGSTYYNLPTAYYRFLFETTSNPGEGGIVNFQDTAGGFKAALHLSANNLLFYGSTGTLLGTSTTTLAPSQVYAISAMIGTGSNATWQIRINGNVEMSGTANLGSNNNGSLRLGGNGAYTTKYYYDDVAINSQAFPDPVPTGTVQFMVDSSSSGMPVPLSDGSATSAPTTTLSIGTHTVTASYSGDSLYLASSDSLQQTVNGSPATATTTTTTVTSSANPQTAGQQVSWTATVTTATGAVNFVNFESGDFSQAASHVGGAIVSSPVLGGTYALQLQRSGSVANYEIRQSGTTYYNLATAYYRFLFEITSNPGEGGVVNFQDTASGFKAALHLSAANKLLFYGSTGTPLGTGSTTLVSGKVYDISAMIGTGSNAAWEILVNGSIDMSGTANLGSANNGSLRLGGNGAYIANYYYDDVAINSQAFPGPVPAGTVQFMVDSSFSGMPVPLSDGMATSAPTSTLPAGNHPVTASYSGDSTYAPSSGTLAGGQTITGQTSQVNFVDFETGDFSQTASHVGGVIVTRPPLDGTYTLQLQRSGSVANCEIRQSGTTYYNLATAYYRFLFENAANPGEGGVVNFQDTSSGFKAALHLNAANKLLFYDCTGTLLATGATTLAPNQVYAISAMIGTGSTAAWEVRINGVVDMSGSANLGSNNNGSLRLGGNGAYTTTYFYDDVAINSQTYPGGGGAARADSLPIAAFIMQSQRLDADRMPLQSPSSPAKGTTQPQSLPVVSQSPPLPMPAVRRLTSSVGGAEGTRRVTLSTAALDTFFADWSSLSQT
jgi:hypothetical protein